MEKLKYTFKDGRLKVVLTEDISSTDFEQINNLISELNGVKYLGIDMYNCVYIQSKILAELIALKKTSMSKKFEISLLNVNDNVLQVLEMASLLSFFNIEDDFSTFDVNELCEQFLDPIDAQTISDYLALNYDSNVRSKLEEIIKGDDPIKTEYAILTMGKAQDQSSVQLFRDALDNGSRNVRLAAILVLGWVGDTASKEKIYSFLSDKDAEITEVAAASIALLSDNTDSDKLVKYLSDSHEHICRSAVQAISLINDESGYKHLVEALAKEERESIEVSLTRAISHFNKSDVREILIKLLDHKSIAVREAAASGIARIGPDKYIDKILEKVTDNDQWVGFFAAKALIGICNEVVGKQLIAAYEKVEQNVKLAIIDVLGKCSGDPTEFLLERIHDNNEDIRKEALNALDNIGGQVAINTALKLYDSDESWLVRYKAVDMIIGRKPAGYQKILKDRLIFEENRYVREKLLNIVGD